MFLNEVYPAAKESCLDPLVFKTLALKLYEQLLMVIHVQLSPTQPRFNVLQARHVVEDALEEFDRQVFTDSKLSSAFQKDEKTFIKTARCVDHVPAFLEKYKALIQDCSLDEINQEPLTQQALQLEIQRQLDLQSKARTPITNVHAAIERFKSEKAVSWSDLEELRAQCKLRSVLPLLAVHHAVHNDLEGLFVATFEPSVVGPPIEDPTDADSAWLQSIRKAKKDPSNLSRVIVAAKNHLLIRPDPSKDFVAIPEPLAHQVAVVPGVDVPEDRCILFVGDPKTKTGALLFVKLQQPSVKRIAVFDLDCEKGTFNFLTSDRDSQGNILLSWGLQKQGRLLAIDHACVREDNLVVGKSMKKQSGTKLQFEDFGDPIERWTSKDNIKGVRFDFRDHGNLLSLNKKSAEETTVVGVNKNLLTVPQEVNAVFGQPLSFVLARNYKTIELWRAVNGSLTLADSADIQFPYLITSITCV